MDLQIQPGNSIQIPKSVQEKSAREGKEAVAVFWPCFPLGGKKTSMLPEDTELPLSIQTINVRTVLTYVEKTCQIYLLYLSSNCFQLCSMAAVSWKLSQKQQSIQQKSSLVKMVCYRILLQEDSYVL